MSPALVAPRVPIDRQVHIPKRQRCPGEQTMPHIPQLFGSLSVLVQKAPQAVRPPMQD